MTELEKLSCKTACQDLLSSLCVALDAHDSDRAIKLFSNDAILVTKGGELRGEAARSALRNRPQDVLTRHIISNVLITPITSTAAVGEAYCILYSVRRTDGIDNVPALPATPQALGEFRLEFQQNEDGWKLSRYESVPVLIAPPLTGNA